MTVTVIQPGLGILVTGLGHHGRAHLGFPPGGTLDPAAHIAANLVVGNPIEAPTIECLLVGRPVTMRADDDHVICVLGADAPVLLDGQAAPRGMPLRVAAGTVIQLGPARSGARAVVAVAGGARRSAGDIRAGTPIGIGGALRDPPVLSGSILALVPALTEPRVVRIVPGPDETPTHTALLAGSIFTVTTRASRMGVRFDGAPLPASADVLPQGMPAGAVQLPPDGRPIILLADRPITGGYPVVATVPTIDLGLVGQLRPGDDVRFEPTGAIESAERWRLFVRALRATIGG